jgi:hypothetical protein
LLISHRFSSSNKLPRREEEEKIKPLFGNIPVFLEYPINFCFNMGP